MKRWIGLMILGLAASTPSAASAGPVNLGTANDYNVFVLGNDTQSGSDVQGRVAVGGNALFGGSGFAIATSRGGSTTNNLVVGGDYSNTNNTVNGNVVVGGNATINNPTINGNLSVGHNLSLTGYGSINGNVTFGGSDTNPNTTVHGSVSQGTVSSPINFSSEQTYLTGLSTALAALTSNGSVAYSYGQLSLTGTNALFDVFHVNGSDLASANGFSITAPAGATVVIDVDGSADKMQNFGFSLNGIDQQHVLFNFSAATSLTLSGIGIQGSILAPLAAINFNNGNINGTLVGNSVTGNGESHDFQFQGDLSPGVGPSISPGAIGTVPEPATILSTSTGLAMFGLCLWRRRRHAS